MTHLKIFEKIMEKAIANGYAGPSYRDELGFLLYGTNHYCLIFREDFAKSIWSENDIDVVMHGMHETMPAYLYHLTKMVQSEDKWKYLKENAI